MITENPPPFLSHYYDAHTPIKVQPCHYLYSVCLVLYLKQNKPVSKPIFDLFNTVILLIINRSFHCQLAIYPFFLEPISVE